MNIAILGSWKEENAGPWGLRGKDLFAEACYTIGQAIVRNGHALIAASANPTTADFHAIQGAYDAMKIGLGSAPRVVLHRPSDQRIAFSEQRSAHPEFFVTREAPHSRWDLIGAFQIRDADKILVIGGSERSYQTGLYGAVTRKYVLPISSFGGGAKRLATLLSNTRQSWGENLPSSEELGQLDGPWSPALLRLVESLALKSRPPKVLIIHGRSADRFLLKNYLQNTLHMPEPKIMAEQSAQGDTLPEKFESIAGSVHGAVGLVTPDDEGHLTAERHTTEPRARQNVWLEVGWFWGRLGRNKLLLLVKGDVAIPSDLAGYEYVRYSIDPAEASEAIRNFVIRLGTAF